MRRATDSTLHKRLKEGFKLTLKDIQNADIPVHIVATDRHVSIKKEMRQNFQNVDHQFDVWHLAKNLRKRLKEKAKQKRYADIQPWVQSICNHLWCCSTTCGGNAELLREKWCSILYHICNVPSWVTGTQFHECSHPQLSPTEVRKKKWLKNSSPSFVVPVLQDVVLDPKLLEDMKHLTKFCHTGSLEVYHSLYNKYMPKRQHFSYKGMTARTMLAAFDNNKHSGRQQATVQKGSTKGDLRFNVVHPKGRDGWVAKPLYERKNYGYVQDMMVLWNCVPNTCGFTHSWHMYVYLLHMYMSSYYI